MATKSSLVRTRSRSRSRSRSRTRGKSPGGVQFTTTRKTLVVKKNKKAPGVKNTKHNRGMQLHLSKCALDWAALVLNPCGGVPCCIPTIGASASRKLKTMSRGSFSTQTSNGVGFIGMAPGVGVCNDLPVGFASSAAGTGAFFFSSGTGVNLLFTNSDYPAATIGVGKTNYRLTGACLRIRYVGTVLNKAGSIYVLAEPDHQVLNAATTGVPQFRSYASCVDLPVSTEWTEVLYGGPVAPAETDYLTGAATSDAAYNGVFMGMMITSPAGTPLPFDYEYWCNYEVIGPSITGKTPSMADPTGLSAVTNGVQMAMSTGQSGHHGSSGFMAKAITEIGVAAKEAITYVGPAWNAAGGVEGIMKTLLPMIKQRAMPAITTM